MRSLFSSGMKGSTVKTMPYRALFIALCLSVTGLLACAGDGGNGPGKGGGPQKTDPADSGIKVPSGFKATVVAQSLGRTRHLAVTDNGMIYVKLERLKDGKGIVRLKDSGHHGTMDDVMGFGHFGGTGMAIRDGYLYASSDEEVFRYKLDADGNVISPEHPEKIVTGLLQRGEHEAKAITLDYDGNLYVNIGAYSNACQVQDRTKGSPAMNPCPILDSAGGIWKFKAGQPNQTYKDGVRYATGLRNVVGLDWNKSTNSLFVMQHGRDQLSDLFPQYFDTKQSAELPAECMYELHMGSNCGWPYIYYDQIQHKKVLAPEYGGDGKKDGDAKFQDPVAAYPGHLAPNGLLFYTGTMFPERYRNGAFIAFHGSWNRAPEPQKGYFVVFQPFKDGKPSGAWEVFADNFSGSPELTASGRARHRPCGLAQGPDGSLYVTDDSKGTIWKITYNK
ncbi:MAG: PQQ-dependent sugar dehydrogenase [Bacteroidota bacterium]|nr:PQQ-dependent sugar dehydrogenase [Bacteroidota bacterium]MDP4245781.1 PQQ-dependent sugar dehydrogenase [Bacteroidota bacterium]MDP4257073.1 PQQ-dependent sugar dehydrogenase [Bacteroidota bacterium]